MLNCYGANIRTWPARKQAFPDSFPNIGRRPKINDNALPVKHFAKFDVCSVRIGSSNNRSCSPHKAFQISSQSIYYKMLTRLSPREHFLSLRNEITGSVRSDAARRHNAFHAIRPTICRLDADLPHTFIARERHFKRHGRPVEIVAVLPSIMLEDHGVDAYALIEIKVEHSINELKLSHNDIRRNGRRRRTFYERDVNRTTRKNNNLYFRVCNYRMRKIKGRIKRKRRIGGRGRVRTRVRLLRTCDKRHKRR